MQELSRLEAKLRHQMPTANLDKLEPAFNKIHQAKYDLDECSKLPAMQVDLLDVAVDPVRCNREVKAAMEGLQASLEVHTPFL